MESRASRPPAFSLAPLIGEAWRRARQRRLFLVALLLVLLGVALGAFFGLRGPSAPGQSAGHGVQAGQSLAHMRVPMDAYERQWRRWIRSYASGSHAQSSRVPVLSRELRSHVAASGATVVRLKLWPTTAPPSVELVVATATPPAVYLKHGLWRLLGTVHGEFRFVEVVDRRGSIVFQNMYRVQGNHTEGLVGVAPRLRGCSPVQDWGESPPPCPVK